ncbi:repetitive organellar protein-like [Chironomus tepperi]|uniref:repetitive organellar protein-like n=1 Tax=Chironomus tepperi TaxID=113505 RepID=UPI00391EFD80
MDQIKIKSNTGRIIIDKTITDFEFKSNILSNISEPSQESSSRYVIDKDGKIVERKKKCRLYSLGGYEPRKQSLIRMKTVGTFDLCMEVTAAACGFNQNQETKTNMDNNGLDEKSVTDDSKECNTNNNKKDNVNDDYDDEIEKEKYSTTSISPKRQRHISSSENSLTVDDNLLSSNIKKKFRSLSSNSYLGNSRDDYRCKSAELLDSKTNENFENILTCASSAREFRNRSDEKLFENFRNASEVESKTSDDEYCKSNKSSSSNIPLSARRRTLKKSKKIIRTDSELFKDQALLKDLDNSPSKKSIVQESKTNSIEGSEKSSKNMSTDTVFSETCEEEPIDLERLEKEYKEHIRSSLQREYKSDGDSLDEIGKDKYPATEWKNQSIDLNFLEDNNTNKYEGYCNRPRKADSVVEYKPARKDSGKRTKSEGDKDTLYTDKNDSIETQSTTEEENKIESEQSAKKEEKSLSLFERRFGKFRKMNKLLKVKRFSTSALYDNNKKKDSIPQSKTKVDSQQQATPLSLYSQVNELTSSKASLASPKSLKGKKFMLKKRKFSFFGKSQSNNDINLNLKSIASKLSLLSKSNFDLSTRNSSNLRLNAMGIYGKYGTSNEYRSDILTLQQHGCTSPLSEAFYNETGSYQLTAMELFEKFCSQDFTGLYKHEPLMESDENTNVDTGHTYKKATSLRKATLLKQNSEPKFNIKSYSSDYYKDQSYYPNPPEAFEEEELECSEGDTYEYQPPNLAERRRSSYTRQHQVEFDQNDQYFEDDERNYYCQEEDQAEEEEGEEEGEEEEEPDDRLYRIEGDVDEIYFVPDKERYESSFLRNSEEILAIDETDEENFEEEEKREVVEVIMESREEDYCDQKSKLLSLYEICPKDHCDEDEDSVLGNLSSEKDSNLKNIISEYVKNACTSASENITRSKSLDLLSNSSETLKTNSNSEYAFDTVKQINLDSCSTSKLSLSLNSDIFDDITLAAVIPDTTIKTLKISEIDDFTITPEGSITESNEGKLVATLSSEISEQEKIKNELQSQYTIIDCDELEHDDDDDEVRRFNDEKSSFAEALNKEFDKLFSRAKNDSDTDLTTTPSVATTVLTAIKLPSRCSMEKLEPFDIDSDDIIGSVSEEKEKSSIKVMSQSMTSTTLNQSISTRSRDEQLDKDKSKRSHSLGAINKRKSNKCTPL